LAAFICSTPAIVPSNGTILIIKKVFRYYPLGEQMESKDSVRKDKLTFIDMPVATE
jgi:hypothetical protein